MTTLAQVNRTTLREQVLAQLRARILSGDLPPGTKMAEVDLAAQLGVSRGTVREALRTLHEGGLLQGTERGSLHVRTLSPREIREIFEVRTALEGQSIRAVIESPHRERLVDELGQRGESQRGEHLVALVGTGTDVTVGEDCSSVGGC